MGTIFTAASLPGIQTMAANRGEERALARLVKQLRLAISGQEDGLASLSDVGGLPERCGGLSLAAQGVEKGVFRLPNGQDGLAGCCSGGLAPAGSLAIDGGCATVRTHSVPPLLMDPRRSSLGDGELVWLEEEVACGGLVRVAAVACSGGNLIPYQLPSYDLGKIIVMEFDLIKPQDLEIGLDGEGVWSGRVIRRSWRNGEVFGMLDGMKGGGWIHRHQGRLRELIPFYLQRFR